MFGLGFWEIVTLLVVIIVFLRPEDVPGFLRRVGKAYGKLSDLYRGFVSTVKRVETELQRPVARGGENGNGRDARAGETSGIKPEEKEASI